MGERRGIGDDERDGLSDVVDLAVRERRPEGLLLLLPPHALVGDAAREGLPAGSGVIGASENEVDALARGRGPSVDRYDLGLCTVRSQQVSVGLPAQVPIRDIP